MRVLFLLICVAVFAFAEIKTFTHNITQVIGDSQSADDARKEAINKARANALREAGEFIITQTTLKNNKLTNEEVETISAAIVKSTVKNEQRYLCDKSICWNITVESKIDSASIPQQVDKILKVRETQLKLQETEKQRLDAERRNKELAEKNAQLQKEKDRLQNNNQNIYSGYNSSSSSSIFSDINLGLDLYLFGVNGWNINTKFWFNDYKYYLKGGYGSETFSTIDSVGDTYWTAALARVWDDLAFIEVYYRNPITYHISDAYKEDVIKPYVGVNFGIEHRGRDDWSIVAYFGLFDAPTLTDKFLSETEDTDGFVLGFVYTNYF